jgi:hypothetical protein
VVFENKLQRKTPAIQREVLGNYLSQNSTREGEPKSMKWACNTHGQNEKCTVIFVGKREEKTHNRGWGNNINISNGDGRF